MDIQNFTNQTVDQILNCHINKTFGEFSTCISGFYSNCPSEFLRIATMELIIETYESLSTIEYINYKSAITYIYKRFESLMKDKEDHFAKDVFSTTVPEILWTNAWTICFPIASQNKSSKDFLALDFLFHIRKPETKSRKDLINKSVQKLFENEITSKKGVQLVLFFSMNFTTCFTKFCSKFPAESVREATMKLIIKIYSTLSTFKNIDWKNTIVNVYKRFELLLKENEEDFVKAVISGNVPKNIWENAWEICFEVASELKSIKSFWTLDSLFHIREPETRNRKAKIYESVRNMLESENTFNKGVRLILSFNMEALKEAEYENILYKSILFGTTRFFTSPEDKFRSMKILDDCLFRAESKKAPKSKVEEKFIEAVNVEALAEMIQRQAKKYKIDIAKHNFYAYKSCFIAKVKNAYKNIDKFYFELFAWEALKNQDETYKLDYLEVLSDDVEYAYCWAKNLKISQENMPSFLQNFKSFECEIKIIPENTSIFVEKDSIETCKFWGKPYKLITVITPEAFENFIDEYFVKQKPKIVGIDCEADKKSCITVLQLATSEWICLIDVQALFDQITENKWQKLFEELFDPSIIRIGFAFFNDYIFLCRKFPFLSNLISQKQRKLLCLQKLIKVILNDEFDVNSILCNEISVNSGLAKLSKAVLNIDLDKSMQRSDWSFRPLTQFQKIYAVSDALIVILIKDEMEKRLQKQLGYAGAKEVINEGFIIYDKNLI